MLPGEGELGPRDGFVPERREKETAPTPTLPQRGREILSPPQSGREILSPPQRGRESSLTLEQGQAIAAGDFAITLREESVNLLP